MIGLEKQGVRTDTLAMPDAKHIQMGDMVYEVCDTGIDEAPGPGVQVDVIAFTDPDTSEQMDAALIKVEPGHSTPIQHWIGPRIFIESIVKGKATWVGLSPEGEVVICEFDSEKEINPTLVYGYGWTGSWVAEKDGCEFVEICVPPFEEDGTILVAEPTDKEVGDVTIPILFRAMYRLLMELDDEKEKTELVEITDAKSEVRLVQFSLADAREIFALIDRNRDHLSQHADDTAGKYETLQDVVDSIVNPKNPDRLRMAIRDKKGNFLGSINLTPDEIDKTRAEIGYYLGSEFTGKGYMTMALKLITDYALSTGGYETVYGVVDKDNTASAKVLIRGGYSETSRSDDEIVYSKSLSH